MNQIQAPRSGGNGRQGGTVLPRGHRLGGYTIDGVSGRGASGVTYLAHDADGAAVALKALDAKSAKSVVAAFRREAEILGILRHPNIVGLKHFEPAGDVPFMVQDQVGGRSLADLLHDGDRLPDLKTLLSSLSDALEHVHGAGYLHRDIKPGNIVLTAADIPVVIDFGAALPIDGSQEAAKPRATPAYGALEQFVEDGLEGPWTDLYALAAVAYRIVTGAAPVSAQERADGVELRPAVEATKSACPRAVLEAIDWALEQAVHRRPQSVSEWRAALSAAWTAKDAGPARAASPSGSPPKVDSAPPDDYPPTEEITRVTPPKRRKPRKVPLDLPVAPGSHHAPAPARQSRGNTAAWIAVALGIVTWGSIAAGGYFYGWPYYLRNIKAEWLVDAGGDGDVLTIGEALETAKEGALIEVMPGIYAESLTVARPVVLTGLGVAADGTPAVVVAPETGACLTAGVGPVTVSGFSFQLGGSADAAGTACVDLAAGVTFQGNHVDANGGPALHVGGGADPVVTGNRLAATEAPALLIDTGAVGQFRDNSIGSADRPGIVVAGAAPLIESNMVEGTGLAGIVYDEAAAGRLAGNTIRQAGASGIEIRGQSNPEIAGNRIEASRQAGIFVHDDGRGRIDGNTVTGNAFSGVVIADGKPTLTGNTITENVEHGILVLSGAGGILRSNVIERNGGFGLALEQEVGISQEDNQLTDNRAPQIRTDGVVQPFPDDSEEDFEAADDSEPGAAGGLPATAESALGEGTEE